jgi:hypothetical protein
MVGGQFAYGVGWGVGRGGGGSHLREGLGRQQAGPEGQPPKILALLLDVSAAGINDIPQGLLGGQALLPPEEGGGARGLVVIERRLHLQIKAPPLSLACHLLCLPPQAMGGNGEESPISGKT